MKKVGLFLNAEPHDGGAFQYSQAVLNAFRSLRGHGFETVIAASQTWRNLLSHSDSGIVFVRKDLWGSNFDRPRFINMPVGLSRALLPRLSDLGKALVREQCDLWIFPAQDVWSFQIPVPSLVSVYDLMHRYEPRFPEVSAHGEYRMREWRYRNICNWARGVLVDSECGKRHFIESYGYRTDNVFVLPFVAPPVASSPESAASFNSRYALPQKFIFYPAQFWEHKNHIGLIRAINRIQSQIPDISCVLVGSRKNAYFKVAELVRGLGLIQNILFLGYVPDEDMPQLYRRARALVMPTFFGPTNIPPLEAFARGCPVVTSRIYGIPDQVGDAALLFDPRSVDELAQAIFRIWTDDTLCEVLKEKGFQRAAAWDQAGFDARFRAIIERAVSSKETNPNEGAACPRSRC